MTIHPLARIMRARDDYFVPEWTLGDRMRKALEASGTPVHEIAEYLDVTPTTISRWIHDKTPVKRSAIMIWAATTGVDPEWLETGTAGLENQTGRDQYAIRDSNPEPADMSSRPDLRVILGVNERLTVDRIPAGLPVPEPRTPVPGRESGRHLRAVS
jgi:transcriptional regulator with XRE-family HTH domain